MNTLTFAEIFIISLGVSMDAFAVAICKGLSFRENSKKKALIVAAYFGVFQALMPLIGYLLGTRFQDSISSVDHWIAFVLLGAIGINMMKEANESKNNPCVVHGNSAGSEGQECSCEDDKEEASVDFKSMVVIGVATSIDALAVGVTFAFLKVDLLPSISFIGIITFVLSLVGVKIGNTFGVKFKYKAELFGGIVLIIMSFRILFDHLGIINF